MSGRAEYLDGHHFTQYRQYIEELLIERNFKEAEDLLVRIIPVLERSANYLAWYYEKLADVYALQNRQSDELRILRRFARVSGKSTFSERINRIAVAQGPATAPSIERARNELVGQIRIGQNADEVRGLLGEPTDIDARQLKTKLKETWKYFPYGRNRYGLRITIDNGVVVGWDEKL